MRIHRPLAAAFSAVLLASLTSAVPSGANALTAATQANQLTTFTDDQGRKVTRLPNGREVTHRAAISPGKRKAVANQPKTVLVKLRSGASTADRDRMLAAIGGKLARTLSNGYLKITTAGSADAAITKLGKDPAVATAEYDRVRYLTATPNDTYYGEQYALSTIRMPSAWNLLKSASSVVVAVVDTGVDTGHPDLVGRTVAGYNAVSPGASVADTAGHGTFVSGIIAANTNNSAGVAGVTWNGRVMPIKVFDGEYASDSDVAEGITWAVDHGAKVINLSLGGPGGSTVMHTAVKYAVSKGAVVVVSSGNEGNDVPQYPAAFPEVISVGATDDSGRLTDFSSFGEHLDIVAPGFDVFSTFPRAADCNPSWCYGWWSGTSFSAPMVSGVAALLKAKNPSWTPAQIIDRLKSTTRDAGPRGFDPYYGAGMLDAYAALGGTTGSVFPQLSAGTSEPNDVPARATTVPAGSSVTATIAVEGDVDWYKVVLAQDGTLTVRATPPAHDEARPQNVDIVLGVYDATLHIIGHSDGSAPGNAEEVSKLMPAGTYYVKIENFNGSADARNYTLSTYFTVQPPAVVPPFASPSSHIFGNSFTDAVAIGDVNNDRRPDILVATSAYNDPATDNKVLVSTQKADGTFNPAVGYAPAGGGSPSVAVLDGNGDGKNDVFLGTGNGVQMLAQNAAGTLDAGLQVSDAQGHVDLTAADFDKDGDKDIVASGAGIFLLTQGPAGTFTKTQVATDNEGNGEVEVGDLDNDGRLDVVSFNSSSKFAVHLNAVAGWTHTNYSTTNTVPIRGIAVGDVTGDGLDDVVSVTYAVDPSPLDVFKQQADKTLTKSQTINTGVNAIGVELTDWDKDGRLDVVATYNSGPVRLFRQQSNGTLGAGQDSPMSVAQWPSSDCLVLGDLNGDTYPDVVTAVNYYAGYSVAYNSKGALPPGVTLPVGAQDWVWSTSVADFSVGAATARPTTKVTVTMAAGLDPATVNGQTVKLLRGNTGVPVPVKVSYDPATRKITLYRTMTSADGLVRYLPLTESGVAYRVVVGAVRDTDGRANPGYSFSFVG
ncbi:S8 family serine peptidase [Catellatospora vulcania]|uniref:S8 family serine peptidase n=1 Tax=Catellatospora vulcania TaxID=1460450 RepID=UPI0012D438E5|nr:S8 family serine peptidase [Catellatospora vulcania]